MKVMEESLTKKIRSKPPGEKLKLRWAAVLTEIENGASVGDALRSVGVSESAWYQWRQYYPEFREMAELAKSRRYATRHATTPQIKEMSFAGFRPYVFGRKVEPHQGEWVEWFEEDDDHIMILVAPESGKTTTVIDWIVYMIAMNPDMRIGYVSKSKPHAVKQLGRIRGILEENKILRQLVGNLVPGPGDPHPWSGDHIMVATRSFSAGEDEADYTVAAFGAGSQITGSRLDLIILDDADDVGMPLPKREAMWDVILQAGETRLGTRGKMIVIGNRQASDDIYQRIIDQEKTDPGLWRIHVQSAIQEEAVPPDDWGKVVWPEKFGEWTKPNGCKFRDCGHGARSEEKNWAGRVWSHECAWTFFAQKRRRLQRRFSLVYQNNPDEIALKDFSLEMIQRCFNYDLEVGDRSGVPLRIVSLDPASEGYAGMLAYGLYPADGEVRRRVLDLKFDRELRSQGLVSWLEEFLGRYRPKYVVIDRQGPNRLWAESKEVDGLIRAHGALPVLMSTPATVHQTGEDATDFAVTSILDLFLGAPPLLEIPAATNQALEAMQPLVQQLYDYAPKSTRPKDVVMALYYAERLVREMRLDRRLSSAPPTPSSWLKSPYVNHWEGTAAGWSWKEKDGIIAGERSVRAHR